MHSVAFPVLAMVALTFGVAVRMYLSRLGEMKTRRIRPQALASRAESGQVLQDTRAADNYANLFELPVLFYVAAITIWVAGLEGIHLLVLAWLFVASRLLHSIIHLTWNRVLHRFGAFILGVALLAVLWLAIAADLLMRT